uniref:Replicase n=1 Tax=Peony betaflexivirus 1 TaxID=2800951 RepID=A0A7L7QV27_9VIRU|nr:replicase [Peony betaflexivirus 1]
MAFAYRSPVESVLTKLTSEEQSRVSSTAVTSIVHSEKEKHQHFNFALPDFAKQKLSEAGIYLSPFSYEPHSHPICKTVENHILLNVLPSYIDNSFYVVSMKEKKLEYLRARSKMPTLQCLNRFVDSKDISRYGIRRYFESGKKKGIFDPSVDFSDSETLKDLVPLAIAKKARSLLLHDELHYWSAQDLDRFLCATRCDILVGTFVFPMEVFLGSQESLNPWMYKFQIDGDTLSFFPDGVMSEGYQQPLSSSFLLTINEFTTSSGEVYSVDVLYSLYSHCVIQISKGRVAHKQTAFFSGFNATFTKDLTFFGGSMPSVVGVRPELIRKIYLYLRTLKKPDFESAMAKLRQMVDEPSGTEVIFFESFSRFILDHKVHGKMIEQGFLDSLAEFMIDCLPGCFRRYFESFCKRSLSTFIEHLEEAFVRISLRKLNMQEQSAPFFDLNSLLNFLYPNHNKAEREESRQVELEKKKVTCGRRSCRYAGAGSFEPLIPFYSLGWRSVAATYLYSNDIDCLLSLFNTSKRLFHKGVDKLEIINFMLTLLPHSYLRAHRFVESLQSLNDEHLALFILNVSAFLAEKKKELELPARVLFLSNVSFEDYTKNEEIRRGRSKIFSDKEASLSCNKKGLEVKSEVCPIKEQIEKDGTSSTSPEPINDEAKGKDSDAFFLSFDNASPPEFELPSVDELNSHANVQAQAEIKEKNCVEVLTQTTIPCSTRATNACNRIEKIELNCGELITIHDAVGAFNHIVFPDKLKGRAAAFYSRKGDNYFYGSIMHESMGWFDSLDKLLEVNGFSSQIFDHCLIQKYQPGGRINFHADDEKCYPEGNPIVTFNLSGCAIFKIKCSHNKGQAVKEFALEGLKYFIMNEGMQVTHKHAVEALNERVSLTFRSTRRISFLIDDFGVRHDGGSFCHDSFSRVAFGASCYPSDISMKRVERFNLFSVPGDGNCFWHAIATLIGGDVDKLKAICRNYCAANNFVIDLDILNDKVYSEDEAIMIASATFNLKMTISDTLNDCVFTVKPVGVASDKHIFLYLEREHFSIMIPKEGCVIRALAEAFDREESQILSTLSRDAHSHILSELMDGEGLPYVLLEQVFKVFGIRATVKFTDDLVVFNDKGIIDRFFTLKDGHLEFVRETHEGEALKVGKEQSLKVTRDVVSLVRLASGNDLVGYTISLDRAKTLEESFLTGSSGKILTEVFSAQKRWVKDSASIRTVQLGLCVGTFGSGKSYAIEKLIKERRDSHFLVISPRRRLADMFKEKLNISKGWQSGKKNNVDILTYEVGLKKKVGDQTVVVFDELQLFPPGYLDLFLFFNEKLNEVIVMGDPCQSSYDSEKDRYLFDGVSNDLVNVLEGKSYQFCVNSRRFKNSFFNNRLPANLDNIQDYPETVYGVFDDLKKNINFCIGLDAILCASFAEKKALAYMLKDRVEVLTFGESTGLTFRRGAIYLTQEVRSVDEKRILVALSRFSEEINFINLTGEDFGTFIQSMPHSLLYRFCAKKAQIDDVKLFLPGKPTLVLKKKIGSDEIDREARCIGDPWLKTMLYMGNRVEILEADIEEHECAKGGSKSHHPLVPMNFATAIVYDRMKLREKREVRMGDLISEQFRDEYFSKDVMKVSNQCDLFESIYPRHKGSDTVTFMMAVRKRLIFSNPASNAHKYKSALPFGKLMFEVFTRRIPLRHELNKAMLEEATNDFEKKKLEKSIATISNHSSRSCRDWDVKEAFIFMKSQLCTKFENRFRDAKAGQTLACFSHIVLTRFAPWIRYIEKKVLEVLPGNYYIHSGKNFDDLQKWVKNADFSGDCTESDYEAFDASQDATILAFEVEVMKYLRVPGDVIRDYEFIKMNLYSKLGIFSIMRFTGEAGTFLFNTMANMCFTFMRYELTGKECIAFAGDDMCANQKLRVTNKFENILDRLKLKAKVDFKREASFCGWTLGSFGIWKKPQLVYERFQIAKERGTLQDCIDNYAIEISYGYDIGDEIFEHMTEEEACYQQMCVREIIMNKGKLKSEIALKFLGS